MPAFVVHNPRWSPRHDLVARVDHRTHAQHLRPLRNLIRKSGLIQHDFALRIGLDDSKLSKALGSSRRFASLDLARIADLCRVTVDWLITGDEPPLAIAARTTGGSAGTAIHEARRLSSMRSDMADLGFPQPWNPPVVNL